MPRTPKKSTYKASGVDIEAGDELVRRIAPVAKRTRRPEVLGGLGGFGAAFRAPKGMREPIFVAATDGVGTKLRIAFDLDRHDTVGIDLVAMNVNDVLALGAEPLVFLDYFATGHLDVDQAAAVIGGIAEGCRQAGCSLIGGETAEMPSFYARGEYDLAGFVVGCVDRSKQLDGSGVAPGQVLLGLESSGLHSNGFSLARKILKDRRIGFRRRIAELGTTVGEALLEPTRIYAKPVLAAIAAGGVHGVAHITGGGIPGNLVRVLPKNVAARIDRSSWERPPLFPWLERLGDVPVDEMDRTFNQGIGMILVVEADRADALRRLLRRRKVATHVIGETVAGRRGVRID